MKWFPSGYIHTVVKILYFTNSGLSLAYLFGGFSDSSAGRVIGPTGAVPNSMTAIICLSRFAERTKDALEPCRSASGIPL
jgi:hypothetical protein